jgi:hypothetical protein
MNIKNPLMVKQDNRLCVIASNHGIHVSVDNRYPIFILMHDIINLELNDMIVVRTSTTYYKYQYDKKSHTLELV